MRRIVRRLFEIVYLRGCGQHLAPVETRIFGQKNSFLASRHYAACRGAINLDGFRKFAAIR